jgi:hypothetical protein
MERWSESSLQIPISSSTGNPALTPSGSSPRSTSRTFGLSKGLDHLDAVRHTFQVITHRFAGFQAQRLNVRTNFPLLQRIAVPVTIGAVRYPGHPPARSPDAWRSHVGGWTAKQVHHAVPATFHLSERACGLSQLRYDLRKFKGLGLIERDAPRYAYRLTSKGLQVALPFLFIHKRLCGPLANCHFHHRPDPQHRPQSKLEAPYHRADKAIENVVQCSPLL